MNISTAMIVMIHVRTCTCIILRFLLYHGREIQGWFYSLNLIQLTDNCIIVAIQHYSTVKLHYLLI